MWRASVCAVGGLLSVFAAANAFISAGNSVSLPAKTSQVDTRLSFEARWLAVAARKADRLDVDRLADHLDASRLEASRKEAPDDILFLTVPHAQTTVALKQAARPALRNILIERHKDDGRIVPANSPASRPRNIGSEMPVGCEPSFSPVTVPAMAHVVARCLS